MFRFAAKKLAEQAVFLVPKTLGQGRPPTPQDRATVLLRVLISVLSVLPWSWQHPEPCPESHTMARPRKQPAEQRVTRLTTRAALAQLHRVLEALHRCEGGPPLASGGIDAGQGAGDLRGDGAGGLDRGP
jgi:hypothetical protein